MKVVRSRNEVSLSGARERRLAESRNENDRDQATGTRIALLPGEQSIDAVVEIASVAPE
jgi:hypothetical protein